MRLLFLVGVVLGSGWLLFSWLSSPEDRRESLRLPAASTVSLAVNHEYLGTFLTDRPTVGGFLASLGMEVREGDLVWPGETNSIFGGMQVTLLPARPVTLLVDGNRKIVRTTASTAEVILNEAGIQLDEDDIVEPERGIVLATGGSIRVTRVEIREEYQDTSIAFLTKVNEDSELSWRVKKVTQKGEKGVKRTTYRVSYHDGKEVRRKVLKTAVTKEPVTEVVTQGTYVKLGKSHRGAASWYAWTGTMAAANPWLPKGSYVKVTNLDNGKSVIVVINDRGPFVPGRIIDLDKVAFQKIASIGAGVINVKMEEIIN